MGIGKLRPIFPVLERLKGQGRPLLRHNFAGVKGLYQLGQQLLHRLAVNGQFRQVILLQVQTCMALLYKSSDTIPDSGIYRVIHAQHRLPHEVTLIAGQTFPPCAKCHQEVRFQLVRALPALTRERRGNVSLYSLPVFDDDEGSSS